MLHCVRYTLLFFMLLLVGSLAIAGESLWIEAETLDGVTGYCWPMAVNPKLNTTNGNWGLSGPGWTSEWMQGGESGFLSIACGADDDKAVASKKIEIPEAGQYYIWVRYRDNREQSERFQIRLAQDGANPWTGTYGVDPVVEEDNTMKLYWGWSFGWAAQSTTLKKGAATLSLLSGFKEVKCRQIDVIVLTTDPNYKPLIKDRPKSDTLNVLASFREKGFQGIEPLARKTKNYAAPAVWTPKTYKDKGFLYLWNVSDDSVQEWAGDDPTAVKYPYHLLDAAAITAFKTMYGGKTDVPIFSDPRIVPTFHMSGAKILGTDTTDPKMKKNAELFTRWLDANPNRLWAGMMNYYPDTPVTPAAYENFVKKYRDRYVGGIAGEDLGYFYPTPEQMKAGTANAKTRRELAKAMGDVCMACNEAKYQKVYGQKLPDAYRDTIPCESTSMPAFAALCYDWGARTVGYEASSGTHAILSMNLAFLRGAARQNGGLTATYRSCNFGDSATMFSEAQLYTKPSNIYDNFYDVFSGTGMTWFKFDIWYQYMSGASFAYNEQGFDEYWMPGGLTAAGQHPLQLSPKGNLIDRFLRLTAKEPDRGVAFTPVALLLDYAHGWGGTLNSSHLFDGYPNRPDLTQFNDHAQAIREYMDTAYYPIVPKSEAPLTALNENYVPGVFGDIFDVVYAYPDVKKWTTIDSYPVVIVAGDIDITQAEGKRLNDYVQNGGTLLVADAQLTGPGLAELKLPKMGDLEEASGYHWLGGADVQPSQHFRFRNIAGGKPVATTADGKTFCSYFDRGRGRLVMLSVPYGMGENRQAVPVVPRLFAHLSRDLMPVEVDGDVEWMVNKLKNGWAVTLINPAGDVKPQHGIFPTDFRENRTITIRSHVPVRAAHDRLLPTDKMTVNDNTVTVTVTAGSVRIIELN